MPPNRVCCRCGSAPPALKRPKTAEQVCQQCFFQAFEDEVHETIIASKLFKPGERVAIAASGGKDSTVLAHTMTTLNARHGYGLDLFLLSIDEGISGYRDDSLETVKRNEAQYQIPLKIVSYKDLYNWTMDEIVSQIGTKNNCTFCGVFRRQALDRGAKLMKADKLATGHNADDFAETVLLNILRGDVARLGRCASIITGEDGDLPRVKPFKYCYEKEIVLYAYYKKLDYFSTECIYAPFAARGYAREFIKDLEAARPLAIISVIQAAEDMRFSAASNQALPKPRTCDRCGYISSQPVCKACMLLEGLNKGLPGLGVTRNRKAAPGAASSSNAGAEGAQPAPATAASSSAGMGGHEAAAAGASTSAPQGSSSAQGQGEASHASSSEPSAPAAHSSGGSQTGPAAGAGRGGGDVPKRVGRARIEIAMEDDGGPT